MEGEWILKENEALQIRRRQRLLQERAVDVEALNKQTEEKSTKKEEEEKRNSDYDEVLMNVDRKALYLQQKEKESHESQQQELVAFWRDHQRPEQRRDFDLESRDHVTSGLYLLRFAGEDEEMKERLRAQKEQTHLRLLQQRLEVHQARLREKAREEQDDLKMAEVQNYVNELEKTEAMARQAHQIAVERFNRQLAMEREEQRQRERELERALTERHIKNTLSSSLMTEDPNVAHSAFGPHRVICDRWKGMSKEQKIAIHNDVLKQIEENKRIKESEAGKETRCQMALLTVDDAATLTGMREDMTRKLQEKDRQRVNFEMAEEQRENKVRLEDIMRNEVTDEFFNNFGVYPR